MLRVSRIVTLGMGVLGLACGAIRAAEVGTAFTYQGELVSDGAPVNDDCDFVFILYNRRVGGTLIGVSDFTGPNALSVVDGVFTVVLDFGEDAFDGQARWLNIEVQCNPAGLLQTLTPRQEIRAVPYALHALNAPAGHSLDAQDGTATDVVFVDTMGNVGIRTISPTAQLHVTGGDNLTPVLRVSGAVSADVVIEAGDESDGSPGSSGRITLRGGQGVAQNGRGGNVAIFAGHGSHTENPGRGGDVIIEAGSGGLGPGLEDGENGIIRLAGGRVGVGTNFPTARLHVIGGGIDEPVMRVRGNSGAAIELQAGLGSQFGGILDGANISIQSGDGANVTIDIGGDVAGGDAGNVQIVAGAPGIGPMGVGTAGKITLIGGNVGIGTTSPEGTLHIQGDGNDQIAIYGLHSVPILHFRRTGNQADWIFKHDTTKFHIQTEVGAGNEVVTFQTNGRVGIGTTSPDFTLHVDGTAGKPGGGSWSSASDRRLKKNIKTLTGALEKLLALRGVTFEYKDPERIHELPGTRTGMVAQDVEAVMPDWVDEGADGYKRVTYRGFEALTVEAMRDLRAENAALRARLAKIEALVARLATDRPTETPEPVQ